MAFMYPVCDRVVDIHSGLTPPPGVTDIVYVRGDYGYWHYGCDGLDDRGWGCGYRTLQTICDWSKRQQQVFGKADLDIKAVPSIPDIQRHLVEMQDKPRSFLGTKEWIGSIEAGLITDFLYDIPCKIVHVDSGSRLPDYVDQLLSHFREKGSPIMMGGDTDTSSKGIIGVCRSREESYFLILDPHYYGERPSGKTLEESKMLLWRPVSSFMADSFYNLCLPQIHSNFHTS